MLIALSFDDGYLNHIRIARLLSRLNIKATFFLITHLKEFEGKPLLTCDENLIAELVKLGHEVASHTCTHRVLIDLSEEELERELKASKEYLEDIINKEIYGLAYPYGIYNKRIMDVVKRYYSYARATDILSIDDPLNMHKHVPSSLFALRKYFIGAAGMRSIFKTFINSFSIGDCRVLALFIHDLPIFALHSLIAIFKTLNACFITFKELSEMLNS